MTNTPNKIIEALDRLRPNSYGAETKLGWLSRMESILSVTVTGQWRPPLVYPDDLERPLWLEHPFDELYALYLQVEMDRHDRDFTGYNNSAASFNTACERFRKHWQQTHAPRTRGGFRL